ncbi:MAG: L,D-transpeptidase [Cyclobacteriaceae bacterium]|nr:L,D-transpeptidase [Cyclobacteriaceae bacterium]
MPTHIKHIASKLLEKSFFTILILIQFIYCFSINDYLAEWLFRINNTIHIDQSYEKEAEGKEVSEIHEKVKQLQVFRQKYLPNRAYMVVSLTQNTFRLYNADSELILEGLCSTGSYTTLDNGVKQWVFKTPKGVRKVLGKTQNPVWTKPDWAFVEDGLPIPPPRHPSRYEYGVLGKYAINLGDGYLIHGTLYQRNLGQPVTHGCIRLGDNDLEHVFRTLKTGSKVYIF